MAMMDIQPIIDILKAKPRNLAGIRTAMRKHPNHEIHKIPPSDVYKILARHPGIKAARDDRGCHIWKA